nr:histidine kinase [uncultured Carboxylicivirga sp.]
MLVLVSLSISVLFQFGAFFITISLIPKTKFNVAWISISIGLLLMAFRRLNDLLALIYETDNSTLSQVNNWIAVVISATMLIASIYIRKIFAQLNHLENIRKDNESKVLSAILQTEEKERKHFSKELHDGLGPILSSIKMLLSALNTPSHDKENNEILSRTETAVDQAIQTTKEISNFLNPKVLERFGLKKALQNYVDDIEASGKLKVRLEINLTDEIADYNISLILYRVYCELINNTLKHANAKTVFISMYVHQQSVIALYEDDGIGLDQSKALSKGSGILNIKSRVKSINGNFELSTEQGNGIYIKIEIPI